jgi:hypothetical protein
MAISSIVDFKSHPVRTVGLVSALLLAAADWILAEA